MSVGSQRAKTTIVLFFAIGFTHSIYIKKDNKKEMTCYVCTPSLISDDNTDDLEVYSIFPIDKILNIPTCGTNAASNFTLKCPDGYKGCLTKTHGKTVLKSCYEHSITDCKIANNVKYCFCADSYCNDATILAPIPIPTDDEDSEQLTEDGSGQFDDWIPSIEYKYTKQNITAVLNSTTLENSSLPTSSGKLWLPKNINILSIIFIVYKSVAV